jgi:hypothetical protein
MGIQENETGILTTGATSSGNVPQGTWCQDVDWTHLAEDVV